MVGQYLAIRLQDQARGRVIHQRTMRKHIRKIQDQITGEPTGSAVVEIVEGPSSGVKLCNAEIDWILLTAPVKEYNYRGITYVLTKLNKSRFVYQATIKD